MAVGRFMRAIILVVTHEPARLQPTQAGTRRPGARAWLRGAGRGRRGPGDRRRPPGPLAGRRLAWRDGLHVEARVQAHPARRTGARHAAGAVGAHELLATGRARCARDPARRTIRLRLPLRPGPRLSQADAPLAA